MSKLPEKVLVSEVCPRDGWQNHPVHIPADIKIKYIKKMVDYGARKMEITSFVSPKYVPQMGDAKEVFQGVKDYLDQKGVTAFVLALNKRGVEDARAAGVHNVNFVLSASEEHNLRNSRRTIQESMDAFKELASHAQGLHIVLGIPCIFGSPFGDEVPLERIRWIIREAQSVGVEEFGLADTAGLSTPENTRRVIRAVKECADVDRLSLHLHDTYGMAIANAYVGLLEGITLFDSSLAGMGGCPFVPGAKGNVATEDLIYFMHAMGIETGLNLELANQAAAEMAAEIQAAVVSCQGAVCRHS
ncbi:hydroxymethylglutaryl-CoA lyase [Flavonifractor sp. An10]|uniref:hydroxymethylglutaryl-CoA lyase n=1 Tax=Flavonifractor sp. An10 TaxID=1965537 RepID=UPI000B3A0221|nr:hydroxymethylglutaryl-CoA lyase [Flavonifractor sp. An10]OUQ81442.1 hypothetical protein B5E42_12335 [Flavonifractor sp. An10]